MMILSGPMIREASIVYPHESRTVFEGMSYGESYAGYDIRIREGMRLWPRAFSLASSIERFAMPKGVVGLVKDKSTWARQGLSVFNTVIEPGWEGYLTLELANHGSHALDIKPGSPIAQVLFFMTAVPTEGYEGKYQGQEAKPVEAIKE